MPAPSVANSTTITLSGAGIQTPVTSVEWFSNIVVANNTASPVYIATDGGILASAPAAHELEVPAGEQLTFANQQPLPNANLDAAGQAKYQSGVDGSFSQSEAFGWMVQQGYTDIGGAYVSGFPTYVSIWAIAISGTIVVTLQ